MNSFIYGLITMVVFSLFFHDKLIAQNSDCTDAFAICTYGTYSFDSFEGFGSEKENSAYNAEFQETNSKWISWSYSSEGKFNFIIIPNSVEDDLDYILYKSNSSCSENKIVREMMSGPAMSRPTNLTWQGEQGLSSNSSDFIEDKGINDSKDNFLQEVIADKDERYYLLVNNFNSQNGFSFFFEGSSSLLKGEGCNTADELKGIVIKPNPVINEVILYRQMAGRDLNLSYSIYNSNGLFVEKGKLNLNSSSAVKIEAQHLTPGLYYIKIKDEHNFNILKFVKS